MPLLAAWIALAGQSLEWRTAATASLVFIAVLLLLDPSPGPLPSPTGALTVAAAAGGGVLAAMLRNRLRRRPDAAPALDEWDGAAATAVPSGAGGEAQWLRRRAIEEGLDWVRRASGAQRAVLWRLAEPQPIPFVLAVSGGAVPEPRAAARPSPLGWVAREGIAMRLDPPPPWALADAGVVAIRLDHRADAAEIATLEFDGNTLTPDPASVEPILQPLAALMALHAAQAAAETDRRRLDLLLATLEKIPTVLDEDRLARVLLENAARLTGASGAVLARWDGERGRVLGCFGEDGGPVPGAEFEARASELALAARAGVPILRAPGERAPQLPVAAPGEVWRRQPGPLACLPLRTPHGTAGVLGVWNTSRSLDPRGIELLQRITPFAGLQLEHAHEFGRVRESADRDALTGLLNRGAFDRRLEAEAARFDRYGHPLALLLLDIDHFKSINDRWGHEAGDLVLRAVAATVAGNLRDVDHAGRVGGEEFAILLPAGTLGAATDAAERLRAAIERLHIAAAAARIDVTASFGVASCPENTTDPHALVAAADAALYKAKDAGRNRVCRAEPVRRARRLGHPP